jgi:hypothetical protein
MSCHNREGVMCDTRTKLAEKVALKSRRKLLLNRQGQRQDDLLAYSLVDYYDRTMNIRTIHMNLRQNHVHFFRLCP